MITDGKLTREKYLAEPGRKIHKLKIPVEVSSEDINNILVSCFEGGSNYWIRKVYFHEHPPVSFEYASECVAYGGTIRVYFDDYMHAGKRYADVNTQTILTGIIKYAQMGRATFSGMDECGYFLMGDLDASDSDNILQLGIFGEIVFC